MNTYLHERYQASLDVSPVSSPRHSRSSSLNRELPPIPSNSNPATINDGSVTTSVTKHPSVPVWPDEPQTLQRGGWLAVLSCTGDVVIILTSTIFFVFASFVLSYDGRPIADVPNISILRDAARYGPTVFPILFAAIVGQAMHSMAHWRLENGERMKVLDQLLGSTGLFSTIVTQLKFRNIGFVGAGLIALWILSPLGGQASLRVLDSGVVRAFRYRTLYSMDRNASYMLEDVSMAGPQSGDAQFVTNSLFVAALASTQDIQQSGMDSWGNLKIPMLERLSVVQDEADWRSIDGSTNVTYSSLMGIPISAISPTFNTSFNMESWYWNLECPALYRPDLTTDAGWSEFDIPGENGSASFVDSLPGWMATVSLSWAMSTPKPDNEIHEYNKNITRRPVYYRSFDDESGKTSHSVTRANCTVGTTYVEVAATCFAKNCSVIKIRPSTKSHPSLDFALGMDPNYFWFLDDFHSAINPNSQQVPTPLQRFMVRPYAPFTSKGKDLELYKLSNTSFSTSLAQLLNTFWQSGTSMGQITSGIPQDDDFKPSDFIRNNSLAWDTIYFPINATEYKYVPVVRCVKSWLAVLYIATSFWRLRSHPRIHT
ncbi:hypothetical protein BDV96DRAFT_643306 [Lophiotrema nucula]|uniref:Uncharacterized protein n=1 Tax=Lophiotrema nucula TaxID=690887 RepID=A0A6A5ZHW7_9PLEO|nr:hypothetical protein BDV96DRAFT_643306 [Lophiotrema nucula]